MPCKFKNASVAGITLDYQNDLRHFSALNIFNK